MNSQTHSRHAPSSNGKLSDRPPGLEAPITLAELIGRDCSVDFLVDGCLVADQPCIVGGAYKSLKTTLSLHLGASLASASPFLGKFRVPEKKRVLIASAESGDNVIRRNFLGLIDAMGVDPSDLDSGQVSFQWWVPKSKQEHQVQLLLDGIRRQKAEVCILDPMYLILSGDYQAVLSGQGEEIMSLVRAILAEGCTPIIDDHTKKSSNASREPLSLSDITGAGKAEAFRQWILLSRRNAFAPDKAADGIQSFNHELWANIGGSAGFSKTLALDIAENITEDLASSTYSIACFPAEEVQRQRDEESEFEKRLEKERAATRVKDAHFNEKCDALLEQLRAMSPKPKHIFKSTVKDLARCNNERASQMLANLERRKQITKLENPVAAKNGRTYEAWSLAATSSKLNLEAKD